MRSKSATDASPNSDTSHPASMAAAASGAARSPDALSSEAEAHRWRLTLRFSGGALPCDAGRKRIMQWRACAAPVTPYHRPLQPVVIRSAQHRGRALWRAPRPQ